MKLQKLADRYNTPKTLQEIFEGKITEEVVNYKQFQWNKAKAIDLLQDLAYSIATKKSEKDLAAIYKALDEVGVSFGIQNIIGNVARTYDNALPLAQLKEVVLGEITDYEAARQQVIDAVLGQPEPA